MDDGWVMTPRELAPELGVTQLRLRNWLRWHWPEHVHNAPWLLTREQVAIVRANFPSRVSGPAAVAEHPGAVTSSEQRVSLVRQVAWEWDEVVLACALVVRNGWRGLGDHQPEVAELSALLQRLSRVSEADRGPKFRNSAGVARKTADIATRHPDYGGKPTKGGRLDLEVLAEFLEDPDRMFAQEAAIRAAATEGVATAEIPDLDLGVDEGRALERTHLRRERDPALRARKIRAVLAAGGTLACEVCAFAFGDVYGPHGAGYVEVHHRVPLHSTGATRTRLGDLALLCSNCHRMIHHRPPWLTVEELSRLHSKASTAAR